jgi:hypothetical protein
MKGGGQNSRHVGSAVGVMRTLVHMLQLMHRRKVTKFCAKPGGN